MDESGGNLVPTEEVTLLRKHVQELSVNSDEPPPRYIRKDRDAQEATDPSLSSTIPIIDLHLLSSSSQEERKRELEKLKLALTSWGFFQATGHDIPNSLLDEVQMISEEFFDLPMDEKRKYSNSFEGKKDWLQGYGNELVISDEQVFEWSDRLYLLVKPLNQRSYKLWPENPTRFREILSEYIRHTNLSAGVILKSMAIAVGVEENYFINCVGENAPTFARLSYYPPCSRPNLVYGFKPHADGGAITIVLQNKEVEGLQVLKDGEWIKVPNLPHALLVNVADQVEIMSNGVFKSAMHRVMTNPDKQRISVAVFYMLEGDKDIEPAPTLISESRPQLFRKMKSEEYGQIHFEKTVMGIRAIDCVRV